jgi:5-methylcytosine-specific restriction endonuclease McrA
MARDKENLNRWQREYYQKRKSDPDYLDEKRASAKRYYNSNKEIIAQKHRNYFIRNREKYAKYRREYRYNNPVGIYSTIKDGLNNKKQPRKILLKISKDDFVEWYNSQEKICFYCKRTFEETQSDELNRKVHRLTIDRIDNSKGYERGNLALACLRCNAIKNNYFTKEEMLIIGKIIHDKIT